MRTTPCAPVLSLVVLSSSVLLASSAVAATQEVDVTGTWVVEMMIEGANGPRTISFEQDGEILNGTYTSDQVSDVPLTGMVKGREISFSFSADAQGFALEVTFTGTVEGNDTMEGTVSLGGLGDGIFTGTRQ